LGGPVAPGRHRFAQWLASGLSINRLAVISAMLRAMIPLALILALLSLLVATEPDSNETDPVRPEDS
jgi:hypothetical protein